VPDAPGDYHVLVIGRPLLETIVRNRVTSLPNVSLLWGGPADWNTATAPSAPSAVSGQPVRSKEIGRSRRTSSWTPWDAMGRSSRLSNWLEQDGYDRPRLERLEAPINYATALFDRLVWPT
jgi:hypothetical protein